MEQSLVRILKGIGRCPERCEEGAERNTGRGDESNNIKNNLISSWLPVGETIYNDIDLERSM